MSRLAMLVIGDEILTGKIQDTNSHAVAKALFAVGAELARIETVPDAMDVIAERVRALSSNHDAVITSGGIGPTHDDITYAAIARAFDRPLEEHAPTIARIAEHLARKFPGARMNAARRRMGTFPKGAQLIATETFWVPVVVVENVYILPGIPALFEAMLDGIVHRFAGQKRARKIVLTQMPEGAIAETLARLDREHPGIAIGSYPQMGADDHKVRVTIEGLDAEKVDRVADAICQATAGWLLPGAS